MFSKVLDVFDVVLTFVEEWVLFISTMVALLALFVNVILRYGFHASMPWSEEVVREVIILTTFIGSSAAIKARSMIKIDALVQLFPVLKTPLAFFSNLVALLFAVLMIYFGWTMAALQAATYQKTIILQIPLVYLYAIVPTMGVMMFIRLIQLMVQDIRDLRSSADATS